MACWFVEARFPALGTTFLEHPDVAGSRPCLRRSRSWSHGGSGCGPCIQDGSLNLENHAKASEAPESVKKQPSKVVSAADGACLGGQGTAPLPVLLGRSHGRVLRNEAGDKQVLGHAEMPRLLGRSMNFTVGMEAAKPPTCNAHTAKLRWSDEEPADGCATAYVGDKLGVCLAELPSLLGRSVNFTRGTEALNPATCNGHVTQLRRSEEPEDSCAAAQSPIIKEEKMKSMLHILACTGKSALQKAGQLAKHRTVVLGKRPCHDSSHC